jgi:HD-GYP domain-containing protein (c-di-GMP phosphodiesterase class II)
MKFSLSNKVFILIIVLLGLQSFFLSYYSEEMTETVLLDESRKQAQVFLFGLEREISSSPDLENPDFLQNKVDHALNKFHELNFSIYRLYLFNSQGKILADSLKNKTKIKKLDKNKQLIFTEGKQIIGNNIEYKHDKASNKSVAITDIIIPMYKDRQVIAAIEVEINVENTLKNIKVIDNLYETKITQFILISGILFMLLLWAFLKYGILTPIQSIEKTAKEITQGELDSRTHLKGDDEIVHLGLSINNMAGSIQQLLTTQEQAYLQVLQSLAKALEAKDPYTAGHSGRVAKYSVKLGKFLNLPTKEIKILKQGALMHDLGKIAIPDHILNKPDKLTEEEFKIMRSHPIKTSDIMKPIRHYDQHREIAAWHHERWDGKGYPDGLTGEEIPLLARIVSIADTWDAMTGDRVYRKGMTEETALSILVSERDNGQWDPQLVNVFVQMVKDHKQIIN